MLLAANCARFLTALAAATFKLGSLRLCVELRHRRLLKLRLWTGSGGLTCFRPNVTWSTDNCLRRTFLLSLTGLSFPPIDFCLRNKWSCCRMVDIFFRFSFATEQLYELHEPKNSDEASAEYFYCNPIMCCDVEQFLRFLCKFPQAALAGFETRDKNSTHEKLFSSFPRALSKKQESLRRWEYGKWFFPSARVEQCPSTTETLFPENETFTTLEIGFLWFGANGSAEIAFYKNFIDGSAANCDWRVFTEWLFVKRARRLTYVDLLPFPPTSTTHVWWPFYRFANFVTHFLLRAIDQFYSGENFATSCAPHALESQLDFTTF